MCSWLDISSTLEYVCLVCPRLKVQFMKSRKNRVMVLGVCRARWCENRKTPKHGTDCEVPLAWRWLETIKLTLRKGWKHKHVPCKFLCEIVHNSRELRAIPTYLLYFFIGLLSAIMMCPKHQMYMYEVSMGKEGRCNIPIPSNTQIQRDSELFLGLLF